METFLTCRELSNQLKQSIFDEDIICPLEEISLKAINKTLMVNPNYLETYLLLADMHNILKLKYPIVNEIRLKCIELIPHMRNLLNMNKVWRESAALENLKLMLECF